MDNILSEEEVIHYAELLSKIDRLFDDGNEREGNELVKELMGKAPKDDDEANEFIESLYKRIPLEHMETFYKTIENMMDAVPTELVGWEYLTLEQKQFFYSERINKLSAKTIINIINAYTYNDAEPLDKIYEISKDKIFDAINSGEVDIHDFLCNCSIIEKNMDEIISRLEKDEDKKAVIKMIIDIIYITDSTVKVSKSTADEIAPLFNTDGKISREFLIFLRKM